MKWWYLVLPVLGVILSTTGSQAGVIQSRGHGGQRRVEGFNPRNARQTDSSYPSVGTLPYTSPSYLTQTKGDLYAVSPYAPQSQYATPPVFDYTLNDYLINSYPQPTSYFSGQSPYIPAAPSSYYTSSNVLGSYPTGSTTAAEEYEKVTPGPYTPSSTHLASHIPSAYNSKLATAAQALRAISECLQTKLQAAERLEQVEGEYNNVSPSSYARNANADYTGSGTPYTAPASTSYKPLDVVEPTPAYVAPSSSSSYSPSAPAPYVAGRDGGPLESLGLQKLLGGIGGRAYFAPGNDAVAVSSTSYVAPTTYTAPESIKVEEPVTYVAPVTAYVAPPSYSPDSSTPYISGRAAGGVLDVLGIVPKLLSTGGVLKGISARGKGPDDVTQEGESTGKGHSMDRLVAALLGHTQFNHGHAHLIENVLEGHHDGVHGFEGLGEGHNGRAHSGGEGGGHHGGGEGHHGRAHSVGEGGGHHGGGEGHHGGAHGRAFEDVLTSPYDGYIDGTDGYVSDNQYANSNYNSPSGYHLPQGYDSLSSYGDGYLNSANNGYAAEDYSQQYF